MVPLFPNSESYHVASPSSMPTKRKSFSMVSLDKPETQSVHAYAYLFAAYHKRLDYHSTECVYR